MRFAGDPFGAILVSGGGDQDLTGGGGVANWLFAPTNVNPQFLVGMWHAAEPAAGLISVGSDLHGMWPVQADAMAPNPYAGFNTLGFGSGASRLVYSKPEADLEGWSPHVSTSRMWELFPAHMYMACRAGGVYIRW